MEGGKGTELQIEAWPEPTEQPQAPFLLLVGVALAAAAAFLAAIFRRRRPSALQPRGTAPEETWHPESPSPAQIEAPPAETARQAGSTQWPTATKYVVGVGLFLALLGLLYFSRGVIPTLILAALVAFIVSPLVRFFNHRLRLKKGLAVAFTYLLVVVILILIPLILLPAIVNAVNSFLTVDFQAAAETVVQAVEQASATLDGVPVLQGVVGPLLDSLLQSLQAISSTETPEPISYSLTVSEAGSTLAEMVGRVAQVVGPVIGAITSVVFMVLISVYFSLSSDQIRSWYPKLVPPGYEPEVAGVFKRIGGLWASYLRGELTLMVLVGTIVWLGNLALGNTNALLLGVISGLMELIPNIGPAIALIPGVLMALLFGSSHLAVSNVVFALIVLAFYLLVQAAENQLIVPHIMGDAVELPPLVVIIGTFVGATTVGILGALLATPVIATGREVFGYLYDKILEPPLTVGPPQEKPSFFEAVTSGMRNLTGRIKLPSRLQVNRLLGRGKRAEGEPLASTVVPEADPNPHADPPAEVTSGTGAASGPTPSPA